MPAVNAATGKTVVAESLLSADGVRMMVGDAVTNYTSFPPPGTILVVMLGVAVAERSGLLAAVLRAGVSRVSPKWVTFAPAFTGMVAHVASDAAYVVLIPLGALAFRAVGRSPLLGIVVASVSISAGYDANPLITPTDAILSGLTTAAAHTVDPAYAVTPLANYFFSLASSLVLAATITVVTERVLARQVESIPIAPPTASPSPPASSSPASPSSRGSRASRTRSSPAPPRNFLPGPFGLLSPPAPTSPASPSSLRFPGFPYSLVSRSSSETLRFLLPGAFGLPLAPGSHFPTSPAFPPSAELSRSASSPDSSASFPPPDSLERTSC
ncbi:AbgT family transporter [Nonomuraea jabiensis]|uniref:Uncharacterized protein n=1 Tax=Nonomuraea jabiensis TaxID=882448 RepID=A0A7W9LC16_9ACTN|nr:AbgT family transporter [Nonomuraea jabiensis]MBB5778255.1 hypothetical protein [Nonomuraea jabiensis]